MYKMSEQGDLEGVRSQVNRGVDVNKVDHYGNSALMSAGRWGREDVVTFLLAKGALINTQNNFGYTALMEAARFGQYPMVVLLVNKGACVNGYIQNDGLTAVQLCPIACKEMKKYLVDCSLKETELKEQAAAIAAAAAEKENDSPIAVSAAETISIHSAISLTTE